MPNWIELPVNPQTIIVIILIVMIMTIIIIILIVMIMIDVKTSLFKEVDFRLSIISIIMMITRPAH